MESPSMLAPTSDVVGSRTSLPLIHRYFILLKSHYFLFFSAFGILYPVLSITLRSRGLSNTEISYINLIIPFLVFFTNPFMGFIADHSRRHLLVFNCILVTVTILYGILFLLPTIKTYHIQAKLYSNQEYGYLLDFCASEEVATKCSSRSACGCSYQSYCHIDDANDNKSLFNFTFTMNLNHTRQNFNKLIDHNQLTTCGIEYQVPIDNLSFNKSFPVNSDKTLSLATCEITCSIPYFCHGKRYSQQLHYILFYSILFIFGTNFLSNAITLGASIGFATLPRGDLFGQQRVWGTIGFGIAAFLASRLYTIFHTEFVYIIMFSITTTICIIVTSFIRIHSHKPKQTTTTTTNEQDITDLPVRNTEKHSSKSKIATLIPLLKKLDVIIFLSLTFIWGSSYAGLDPYVFLYVDEIAPCQSRSVIGWMSLIAAVSEVVAFYSAGRWIKFFGPNLSSIMIFLAFTVRFAGYYAILRPYYLLFFETMHFFNFGILYVLIAQKADSIAPPGLSGTLQGVVYGVSFGLGRGVGLIVSSFIYTRLQSRLLFLTFATFNAVAALFYGIYFLLSKKKSQKSARPNNLTIPKIVIDSEPNIPEEPLLISSSSSPNPTDSKITEQ